MIQISIQQSIYCDLKCLEVPLENVSPTSLPTVECSCDTDLIIRIGRKLNRSVLSKGMLEMYPGTLSGETLLVKSDEFF